jgi:PPOX class probable F420-dependent enzyme
VARLATVDEHGRPHVVPIVYAFVGQRLFTPIDAKPKRAGPHQLKRVRNIQANPYVAVIVDYYEEDWRKLAWVQLRGQAVLAESGQEYATGVALLEARYPQYATMPLARQPIIVVRVEHITGWQAMGAGKEIR